VIIGMINLIHFALYLVGGNVYDIKAVIRRHRQLNSEPYRPLVTVLVPAYNEEKVIERSLQSIWNNTYQNIEIVVISDGSTDGTAEAVQKFINSRTRVYRQTVPKIVRTKNGLKRVWHRGHSPINRSIKLIRQRNGGKASALNNGLRNHAKGELIMMLDADSLLHKRAIANAIGYFDDPKVAGVAANVRIIEEFSVLGILQRFEHMIGYRSKKFFTLANCELIVGGVASTYRRDVLDSVGHYDTDTVTEDIGLSMKIAALGNKDHRLVYGADVAAMTEGVRTFGELMRQRYRWKLGNLQNLVKYRRLTFDTNPTYTKTMTWYRLPMGYLGELLLMLEPFVLGYVLYLSIHFLTIGLMLGAYMTITLYILMTIWPDEHMSVSNKVRSSFYAPFLYFIFYIMNFIQLVSIARCLFNGKKIVNLSDNESSWVTVQRTGKKVETFS
jgi:biofilm PGA synthesis N-glycosyltransferase PgaC